MANESFALDFVPQRTVERSFLAALGYVGLLLVIFVGFSPFQPPITAAPLAAASAADGDRLHQILYLSVFALSLLAAIQRRAAGALRAIPPLLLVLEIWCLASAIWAPEQGVALRRAGLQVMITFAILFSVDTLGPGRAFRYWRILLAMVLAVNWISIPLIATARHLPGEIDPGLIGDWRGLYGQKNNAGAVCTMTILLFLFSRNGKYNWIGILVSVAALGFLIMTRSKTSMALLPVALMAGLAYRAAWRDGLGRAIFLCAAMLLLAGAVTLGLLYADQIAQILEDPTEFTGRAEIWQTYLAFVRDHSWLGTGFGMLDNTHGLSPMHGYARSAWVEAIGDSHNGFLQLTVTLGLVGLALAMLALIVAPVLRFWKLDYANPQFTALLFALFVFAILHNFTESDFVQVDSGIWFALLLVIASLRTRDKAVGPYG